MERMMKPIKALLIAAILVLSLSTCSNPFDFVAAVTDEVMLANHKYLEVTEVTPVKNEPAFSQDDPILIEFNKGIDPSSATDATIVFAPSTTWTSSFDTGTNTLKIVPDLLAENTNFQITVNAGVKGTDGSVLRDPYTWNFHSIPAPTGNVKINNDATYTKSATVTLNVTANSYVTHMRWAQSEVDLASTPYVAVAATVNSYGLIGGEGTRTVYMQFRDNTPPYRETSVKQDIIILDTTPPTVDAGPQRWVNATGTTTPAPTASDLNGIQGYLWTGVSCSPASADVLVPTFNNPGADGNYTVTLQVTDNAGNVSSDTMILTRDGTAPSLAPTFTSIPATPSILPDPTWSWQGNSVNSWGGESPKLFRYRLNWLEPRELTWKPYDAYATMVPDTQYTAPYEPPRDLGLPNSKYRNTAYEPILYRMTVWEMDKVGNLSPSGIAADITITTVLPYNNSTGVGLTPILRWRNILDPETGRPAKYYVAHFGYFRTGRWTELFSREIEAQVGLESSWLVYKDVTIKSGYTFGWYIDAPDFRLRSPVNGIIDEDDYWTFTTIP